jgi:hypothetical protein
VCLSYFGKKTLGKNEGQVVGFNAKENPCDRKEILDAVNFSINSALLLIGWLPGKVKDLLGKTILEIGPGQDLGLPAILIGLGAKVLVVDPYLVEWVKAWHDPFYQILSEVSMEKFPEIDLTPFTQMINLGEHAADGLFLFKETLDVIDLVEGSIDISYSNATFEHLGNPKAAIHKLGAITKNRGLGFHQIDFRDHRDFNRPLEFFTLSKEDFQKIGSCLEGAYCNGIRFKKFEEWFQEVGFQTEFTPNLFVENEYLEEVRPRLSGDNKLISDEELRVLGGRFFLRKNTKQPVG